MKNKNYKDIIGFDFQNYNMIIEGKYLKIMKVKEEWDQQVKNPEIIIREIEKNRVKIDIFSFTQRLPNSRPLFKYYMEWDSIAAIPITTYEYWLEKQIPKQSRNRIKKALKAGVVIRDSDYNDDFVRGISEIYNEVTIKQGRVNKYFGLELDKVRIINSTYIERSDIFGAYYYNELIGYIKIVYTDNYARTMGILGKEKHRDKSPMNLLISKAVQRCAEKGVPYLVYAKYDYGRLGSESLKDFKKNNGFENIIIPRYYIPTSIYGNLALKIRLHKGLKNYVPRGIVKKFQLLRKIWYKHKKI
jgi:hypothetical protein